MSTAAALPFDLPVDPALDRILADTQLGRLAKQLVAVVIRNWSWFKPHCWPSNATVASKLDCHPKSVPRALRELEAAGWADRVFTDEVPTGRFIRLLWRVASDAPGGPGAGSAAAGGPTGRPDPATSPGASWPSSGTVVENRVTLRSSSPSSEPPCLGSAGAPPGVALALPRMIEGLRHGADSRDRAELVNRIAFRFADRKPATYGFIRKWVNAAADGVAGALEALAHGYAKADEAILKNYPCPGRVFVRRVKDFVYRPPAASTIGATAPHVAARPVALAAAAEPAELPTVEQVAKLVDQVRNGPRSMRSFHRAELVVMSKGGPEVPPDVQSAAVEALKSV